MSIGPKLVNYIGVLKINYVLICNILLLAELFSLFDRKLQSRLKKYTLL